MFCSAQRPHILTIKITTNEIVNLSSSSHEAQNFCSGIEPSDLVPAYSGIRAKLTPPAKHGEKQVADFIIQRDPEFPQVVQLDRH